MNLAQPFISICIPTYNMGPFLAQAMESIRQQNDPHIEVVVCDNASTDNTRDVVAEFVRLGLSIRYYRWPENQGFQTNFLKTVELANGRWCWFLGADDVITEGALFRVCSFLEAHSEIAGMSLACLNFDFTLTRELTEWPERTARPLPEDIVFGSVEETAGAIGTHFGFLSCQVCSRKLWMETAKPQTLEQGKGPYFHSYIFLRMIQSSGLGWGWLAFPAVKWRADNDSFMSKGIEMRRLLDLDHHANIFAIVLGRTSQAYRVAVASLCSKLLYYWLFEAKMTNRGYFYLCSFMPAALRSFWTIRSFWTLCLPLALTPSWLFNGLRATKCRLKRLSSTDFHIL